MKITMQSGAYFTGGKLTFPVRVKLEIDGATVMFSLTPNQARDLSNALHADAYAAEDQEDAHELARLRADEDRRQTALTEAV